MEAANPPVTVANRPTPSSKVEKVSWLCLAIIACLLIVIVYLIGRVVRVTVFAKTVQEKYGLLSGVRASNPRPSPLRDCPQINF